MEEFEQFASSTSRYSVKCELPEIRIHLPSKHFLETLYNRYQLYAAELGGTACDTSPSPTLALITKLILSKQNYYFSI